MNQLPSWTPEAVRQLILFYEQQDPTWGTLQTLGYMEDHAQQRLDDFLARPHTSLLDIRYSPRSRWHPEWNKGALLERYGAMRYGHCKELGNENYNRPGASIKLWKPEEGTRHSIRLLRQGTSLILLCACKEYERCHRKIVYELIMAELVRQKILEHRPQEVHV